MKYRLHLLVMGDFSSCNHFLCTRTSHANRKTRAEDAKTSVARSDLAVVSSTVSETAMDKPTLDRLHAKTHPAGVINSRAGAVVRSHNPL